MNDFLFEKGNLDSSVFGNSTKFKICDGITDMLHAINDSFDYFFFPKYQNEIWSDISATCDNISTLFLAPL